MDIYLVPVGPDGYELYCEIHEHPVAAQVKAPTGLWSRLRSRLTSSWRRIQAFLEHERQQRAARHAANERRTRWQRLRDRGIGWMAERVAEQRLLWHLRGAVGATTHHPDDMDQRLAADIVTRSLRRDGVRHARWLFVDLLGLLASAPFVVVPGPNLLGYFFTFRVVGHLLSYLGARNGLRRVAWTYVPCPPLADLRGLAGRPGREIADVARSVGGQLQLGHLETFVERLTRAAP